MSVGHDRSSAASPAPRVLSSAPWIVVMLGVGLLATLLVVALLSLRSEERQVLSTSAGPPIYLPTLGVDTPSAMPTDAPLVAGDSASPSPSVTPSLTVSPTRASPTPARSAGTRTERVTARYQATASNRDWFEARLTVTNGSDRSQGWEVELLFTGNVKSIQASSASGVSVSTQGSGVFVLRGTQPLPSGQSATVSMRFARTGTGDRPGQCTVNGTACVIA